MVLGSRKLLGAAFAFALAHAGVARADTITLTDGKLLENVTVVAESLKEVSFKQDGKARSVSSDSVVSVEFSTKPRLVDQADAGARNGDIEGALRTLATYLDGLAQGNVKEPLLWAPPYAMQRLLELAAALDDTTEIVRAADRLIKSAKESRYLPAAYLSKAAALNDAKQPRAASATLAELHKLIEVGDLSQRWKLEADLAEALSDPAFDAAARRARAIEIAGIAGRDFPMVAARARVAQGESYLDGDAKDFDKALPIFRQVAADPAADARTLAGAWTGLGDCAFAHAIDLQQARQDAKASLVDAVESYMRVVILVPEQARYRAKAMFQAGRALEFQADDASRARARQLYRALIREHKASFWAGEARKQMGG